ncbi:putative GNAT family N-acetyltransferase [Paraburkholderia kururiensis]|uniref:hypothetical protein n=1 Tax=Paraburkholderia kururiensis TaxID=984307 RepID=UPI0039A42394
MIAMLTRAFFSDPLLRWLYPDDDLYSRYFERFVYAYGGAPFPHGSGMTYDDGDGVLSLWHPSGYRLPYEDLHACFTETVPEPRLTDVVAVFDEFARLHPKHPFRYQTFFARDPLSDHRAFPLLEALVRCSDEEELCIGGDVTSAANVDYHKKVGTEVLGVVQRGTSHVYYTMLRQVPQSDTRPCAVWC